jgi:hypothetical protein
MDRIDIAIQLRAFSSLLVESSGDQFRCIIDLHCGKHDLHNNVIILGKYPKAVYAKQSWDIGHGFLHVNEDANPGRTDPK